MGYLTTPYAKSVKIGAGNFERESWIEFNTTEDELMFRLQFGKGKE